MLVFYARDTNLDTLLGHGLLAEWIWRGNVMVQLGIVRGTDNADDSVHPSTHHTSESEFAGFAHVVIAIAA